MMELRSPMILSLPSIGLPRRYSRWRSSRISHCRMSHLYIHYVFKYPSQFTTVELHPNWQFFCEFRKLSRYLIILLASIRKIQHRAHQIQDWKNTALHYIHNIFLKLLNCRIVGHSGHFHCLNLPKLTQIAGQIIELNIQRVSASFSSSDNRNLLYIRSRS